MATPLGNFSPGLLQRVARQQLFKLLTQLKGAGITIHEPDNDYFFGDETAELQASISVLDPDFYYRLLIGGSIGAGESWIEELWTTPDLTQVIRVFARSMSLLEKLEKRLAWITLPFYKLTHRFNRNTKAGSRSNIAAHYDLGNDMYALFLDPLMQYSSAIYPSPDASLAEAQQHKLKTICDKLALSSDDHLLEIGTGWGGLACYAAKHYGCRVTTTTLSDAQYQIAKERVKQDGLEEQITLLKEDYRDLTGQYDKLVSIEMIEAVGHEYLPVYFKTLDRLLKPNGKLLIQSITINDQRYEQYRKAVDFIQRYIFPGGCLPSVSEMCHQLKKQTDMTLTRLSSHGHDYAQTLKHWTMSSREAATEMKNLGYDEDFQRLWHFYFAYCEGGFREGTVNLVQFEAAKPEARIC